jgi:hypothetical protein
MMWREDQFVFCLIVASQDNVEFVSIVLYEDPEVISTGHSGMVRTTCEQKSQDFYLTWCLFIARRAETCAFTVTVESRGKPATGV